MNRYQKAVIGIAAVNVLLMLLVPPFLDVPIGRHSFASFDGFYPVLARLDRLTVHRDLLTMELLYVAINGLTAWLVLERGERRVAGSNLGLGIGLFMALNFMLLFGFPPYESYPGLLRGEPTTFDGFYFVLGDRTNRPLFKPVLYLSGMLVVANALAAWLVLSILRRREPEGPRTGESAMPADASAHRSQAGAGPDAAGPPSRSYRGPERRRSDRRRQAPWPRI